jgi:hypothetical protein
MNCPTTAWQGSHQRHLDNIWEQYQASEFGNAAAALQWLTGKFHQLGVSTVLMAGQLDNGLSSV